MHQREAELTAWEADVCNRMQALADNCIAQTSQQLQRAALASERRVSEQAARLEQEVARQKSCTRVKEWKAMQQKCVSFLCGLCV